jgi:hypothetical protein
LTCPSKPQRIHTWFKGEKVFLTIQVCFELFCSKQKFFLLLLPALIQLKQAILFMVREVPSQYNGRTPYNGVWAVDWTKFATLKHKNVLSAVKKRKKSKIITKEKECGHKSMSINENCAINIKS